MECRPEDAARSWFSPAALASWLARFCSGSNSDDHDELAGDGDNRSTAALMAAGAAARYLTYSTHKIKFA
ncbi:unnamed protein product [Urochloa decumbens]|uniref:Uncharacterized protein n=1 Tax=Urochloa decumbens TaxID=240449 RepID=A0ABC9EF11_9POAL